MSTGEIPGTPVGGEQIRTGRQIQRGEQIRSGEQKEFPRRKSGRISSSMVIAAAAAAGLAASSAAFGSVTGGHSRNMATVAAQLPAGSPGAGGIDLAATTNLVLSRYLKVVFGTPHTELDETGLVMSTVPVTITNISEHAASFDLEFAARDADGRLITTDSAIATKVAAGQSAQIRVFNIVNSVMVPRLLTAHYSVTHVVAN